MSNNFTTVEPAGWEWDLHSVYSAYMGYFQSHAIQWYDRTWGHLFKTFENFLEFSWPAIVVTDTRTARAHIVTRWSTIVSFIKMVKTRYGETLPQVDNILRIVTFETSQRPLRTITDFTTYKKVHATLPAAILSATKARIRLGEPQAIKKLWEERDKTFLAIDMKWSERNESSCLEFGYAALRCGHLATKGVWPPVPRTNYRKGHLIIAEYADKVHNKHSPNFPWAYAFGESQVIPKAKLSEIVQALFSSLASPDSETLTNDLVIVGHDFKGAVEKLHDMKLKIPHNTHVIDAAVFEKQLFMQGTRGAMTDPTGKPRTQGSTLSLPNLLLSLNLEVRCTLNNAGNDAFMCLAALQRLLDPETIVLPNVRGPIMGNALNTRNSSIPRIRSPAGVPMLNLSPSFTGPYPDMYTANARLSPVTPGTGSTPSPGLSARDLHSAQSGYFDEMGHLYPGRRRQVSGNGNMSRPVTSRRSSLNPEATLNDSMQAATLK